MRRTIHPVLKFIIIVIAVVGLVVGARWALNNTKIGQSVSENVAPGAAAPDNAAAAPTGTPTVNVCVVTWVGYAGGQYFNGGFKASTLSRYYKDYGILVNFQVMDVPLEQSMAAWQSDKCQVHWFTADSEATLFDDLIAAGYHPKKFFQADWSRGGDAIVVGRGINTMSDLRGKRIAVAYGTPSHTFLLRALQAANMTIRDVVPVEVGSAPDAAKMFTSLNAPAAVVWSPDDADAVKSVQGSKVLTNTKEARYIIADIFFAKAEWLDSHQREAKALVEGWMKGAAELNSSKAARDEAVSILTQGYGLPRSFFETTINNARWTTYGDNVLFFNLNGNAPAMVSGERIYTETSQLYKQYTNLVKGNPPSWRQITDTSILRSITDLNGPEHAAEGGVKFTAPTADLEQVEALASRPVSITFPTGSATLDDNAKTLIDVGFVPTAQSFAGNRVRIEGNTDSTGSSREVNMRLSERRARAVADYLATTWDYDRNRFVIVGNGPDKPVCNENDPGGISVAECQSRNRRTEFQLLSTQ